MPPICAPCKKLSVSLFIFLAYSSLNISFSPSGSFSLISSSSLFLSSLADTWSWSLELQHTQRHAGGRQRTREGEWERERRREGAGGWHYRKQTGVNWERSICSVSWYLFDTFEDRASERSGLIRGNTQVQSSSLFQLIIDWLSGKIQCDVCFVLIFVFVYLCICIGNCAIWYFYNSDTGLSIRFYLMPLCLSFDDYDH